MRKFLRTVAIVITVLSVAVSLAYLLLLMLSAFVQLPFRVEENFLAADWVFIAVPILALLSSILVQVASLKKKKKKQA